MRLLAVLFLSLAFLSTPVTAQENTATDMGSLEKRVELATQMHQFRPAKEQVDNAIDTVALRLPASEQDVFKTAMRNVLNYQAIEKISIDAMAETFTQKELEVMVEYYSKPETRAISDKYTTYQQKVGPQIVQMIDSAMMRVRTGQPGQ